MDDLLKEISLVLKQKNLIELIYKEEKDYFVDLTESD